MSVDLRVGAIVLSTDCSCVALVRRSTSNSWGFPRVVPNGKKYTEAAKHAVRIETGVSLSQPFHKVTFEVSQLIAVALVAMADVTADSNLVRTRAGTGTVGVDSAFIPSDRHPYH